MADFSHKQQQLTFAWGTAMPPRPLEPTPASPTLDTLEDKTPSSAKAQVAAEQLAETPTPDSPTSSESHRKPPARLPVPKPLPSAVGKGNFGEDERGPVRPEADEVRAITEQYAERLIDLLNGKAEVEAMLANPVCSDRAAFTTRRIAYCRPFRVVLRFSPKTLVNRQPTASKRTFIISLNCGAASDANRGRY